MTDYLMESADEGSRLEAKENPRATRRQLRLAGLRRGMRVLDAGAGSGVVTRAIAKVVGPQGRVVALERSSARAKLALQLCRRDGLENVHVVLGDLPAAPVASDGFDFVWSRFVFEYLNEPLAALRELHRVARPGGRVAVLDLDGNGVFHHPLPAELEASLSRLQSALKGRLDPFIGRKLFSLFVSAGLEDILVHASTHHLLAGEATGAGFENWRYKLATLAPVGKAALGGAPAYERFTKDFLDFLKDPSSLTYSVLFAVVGTKKK
ncbi:MAG: methyltransferase domain-containing protein [Myxococcaceae bacterium]